MNEDEIRDSVMSAIESSAEPLTQILRQHARAGGWDTTSSNSLTVQVEGTSVSVVSENSKAADLEYGTDEVRPNRVIHRFSNRSQAIESTILDQAEAQLRGLL
ncbi:MAG: hypothetical protein WAO78_14925 [Roseovarius sp.]